MTTEITAKVENPILELKDVSVVFEMDRGRSRVVDDISVDVSEQEIFGIVGESGSGKSMFASALLDAVEEPGELSGEILYRPDTKTEVDVTKLSDSELRRYRWEEVSMVFQGAQSSFNPTLSVGGHFRETLSAHGYDVEKGMKRAKQLIEDLYMDPERVLNSYAHELSGGMQQRTLIALSLLLEPNVLVMDEPTAALDLLMQRSILSLLKDLQDQYDLTVVFITHDLPLVAGLADRLGVMYAFKLVEIGPAREIVLEATHPYTRALLRSVPNLDIPIDDMEPIEGSAPDPVNAPRGCSYHPRCPLATDECLEVEPGFKKAAEEHYVACYHYEDAAASVPFDIETHASEVTEEWQ